MFRGHPLETPVGVDRSVCIHHYITVYTCMYVCIRTNVCMYVCMYYIGRERIRRKFILFHFFEITKKNIQICLCGPVSGQDKEGLAVVSILLFVYAHEKKKLAVLIY